MIKQAFKETWKEMKGEIVRYLFISIIAVAIMGVIIALTKQ